MTEQEAQQIAGVLAGADSGCWPCASELADEMVKVFPDYDWRQLVKVAGGWEGWEGWEDLN